MGAALSPVVIPQNIVSLIFYYCLAFQKRERVCHCACNQIYICSSSSAIYKATVSFRMSELLLITEVHDFDTFLFSRKSLITLPNIPEQICRLVHWRCLHTLAVALTLSSSMRNIQDGYSKYAYAWSPYQSIAACTGSITDRFSALLKVVSK